MTAPANIPYPVPPRTVKEIFEMLAESKKTLRFILMAGNILSSLSKNGEITSKLPGKTFTF